MVIHTNVSLNNTIVVTDFLSAIVVTDFLSAIVVIVYMNAVAFALFDTVIEYPMFASYPVKIDTIVWGIADSVGLYESIVNILVALNAHTFAIAPSLPRSNHRNFR